MQLAQVKVVMKEQLWEKYFLPERISLLTDAKNDIHEVDDPLIYSDIHTLIEVLLLLLDQSFLVIQV